MVDQLKRQTKLLLGETGEMIKVWTAAKGEVTIPREEHERLLRLLQGHQSNTELLLAAREKLQTELRHERKLARVDVVTGQANRKAFEEHLGRELSEITVPDAGTRRPGAQPGQDRFRHHR